jgi:hypothetical protein
MRLLDRDLELLGYDGGLVSAVGGAADLEPRGEIRDAYAGSGRYGAGRVWYEASP